MTPSDPNIDYRESKWAVFWLRLRYRLGLLDGRLQSKKQAAALPFQRRNGEIVVLLITSSTRQRWIFPKGGVDKGESGPQAAAREAQEEAGITGKISDRPIGSYEDLKLARKGPRRAVIALYPLEVDQVLENWDESKKRKRRWATLGEAKELITIPGLAALLDDLPAFLDRAV